MSFGNHMNAFLLGNSRRELPVHEIGISLSLVNTAQRFIPNLFFSLKWIRYPVPSSKLDFFHHFHLATVVVAHHGFTLNLLIFNTLEHLVMYLRLSW